MAATQSRFVEYAVFLGAVILVAAGLGALLGLYGERLGIPTTARTILIVPLAIVVGRLFSARFRR